MTGFKRFLDIMKQYPICQGGKMEGRLHEIITYISDQVCVTCQTSFSLIELVPKNNFKRTLHVLSSEFSTSL